MLRAGEEMAPTSSFVPVESEYVLVALKKALPEE